MIEGLWSVAFVSTQENFGAGVVIFETGRVLGGDASYYYVGDYNVTNGELRANVHVTHFFGEPHSVFGNLRKFELSVSGRMPPEGRTIEATGHLVQDPRQQIAFRFQKLEELP